MRKKCCKFILLALAFCKNFFIRKLFIFFFFNLNFIYLFIFKDLRCSYSKWINTCFLYDVCKWLLDSSLWFSCTFEIEKVHMLLFSCVERTDSIEISGKSNSKYQWRQKRRKVILLTLTLTGVLRVDFNWRF